MTEELTREPLRRLVAECEAAIVADAAHIALGHLGAAAAWLQVISRQIQASHAVRDGGGSGLVLPRVAP